MMDMILSLSNADSDVQKTGDPLVFWKEIAHAGKFKKGSQEINITPRLLDHWKHTFGEMRDIGMAVPVPVEHTSDPEKRRGEVLKLARRDNSRGQPALYAKIKFRDADAAKLVQSGVSVWSPKRGESGYGHEWKSPLTHVAITDYPVIPDLEPFTQALALSFGGPPEKKPDDTGGKPPAPGGEKPGDGKPQLTLRSLADRLGVDPSITDEQQLLQALAAAITAMRGAQQQMPPRPPMPMQPMRPPMMPMQPMRPPMAMSKLKRKDVMAMSKKQFKKLVKSMQAEQATSLARDVDIDDDIVETPSVVELSGNVLQAVRTGRQAQIDALHKEGFLTAAGKKELEDRFVKSQTVALSHQYDDGFDFTVSALTKNGKVVNTGKSGPQVGALALSKTSGADNKNALLADAERRAKGEVNNWE